MSSGGIEAGMARKVSVRVMTQTGEVRDTTGDGTCPNPVVLWE